MVHVDCLWEPDDVTTINDRGGARQEVGGVHLDGDSVRSEPVDRVDFCAIDVPGGVAKLNATMYLFRCPTKTTRTESQLRSQCSQVGYNTQIFQYDQVVTGQTPTLTAPFPSFEVRSGNYQGCVSWYTDGISSNKQLAMSVARYVV